MSKETLGSIIIKYRKEKGMTQLDLANLMGVTDKAVSKWERNISCPDINTIPKLAELFGISVDELMQNKVKKENKYKDIVTLILKVIPLAMGIAVVVLSILKEIDMYTGFTMLGIGMACLSILLLENSRL